MKPHRSQTIVGVPCHRQLLPATSIPAEEHTNRSTSLRSTFRWKPCWKRTSHALTRANLRSDVEIHAPTRGVRVTLFSHTPSSAGASVADKPIHPLHVPRRSRKNPSFLLFRFGHCYCVFCCLNLHCSLCFLELYDIFRTLGVVSVDSY